MSEQVSICFLKVLGSSVHRDTCSVKVSVLQVSPFWNITGYCFILGHDCFVSKSCITLPFNDIYPDRLTLLILITQKQN
jgi:hypothetical protein